MSARPTRPRCISAAVLLTPVGRPGAIAAGERRLDDSIKPAMTALPFGEPLP
jgi:hypothetical protein